MTQVYFHRFGRRWLQIQASGLGITSEAAEVRIRRRSRAYGVV